MTRQLQEGRPRVATTLSLPPSLPRCARDAAQRLVPRRYGFSPSPIGRGVVSSVLRSPSCLPTCPCICYLIG
eukprot:366568-Chlamydomonas_euryale.AAC.5